MATQRPRRVALCVDRWSSDATLVLWSYARRAFLRVSVCVCVVGGKKTKPFFSL